jgi:uncharacterized protein (DUF1501 family)
MRYEHKTCGSEISRRDLLKSSGLGFGQIVLAYLLNQLDAFAVEGAPQVQPADFKDSRPRTGHFKGTAKAMIQLMQNGGPSQMDLFDPKPELTNRNGQPHPQGVETFQPNNRNILLKSPYHFEPRGQSGIEMSDVIPHLAGVADDLCMIRSMHTEHSNHTEALIMLQTCKIFPGRPAIGSWITYALGTENQNLPAYIVLRDPAGYNTTGKLVWSSGWLSALYQGVEFNSSGAPVHNLYPALALPPGAQRDRLDFLAGMNASYQQRHPKEIELEARIQNFELAARMQLAATGVLDVSKETDATRKLYGLDNPITAAYGTRCLMARRLIEAGVRFVQVFPPVFQPWDNHIDIEGELQRICAQTDQPSAALIKDLKGRGLLDSTMIMWTGEFGRLPITENGNGRDHNRHGFTTILAGGGFKGGFVYGETDEFGYKAVVNPVSVPDLQATVLAALGIDHKRFLFLHNGAPETPTDVLISGANVVAPLMKSPPSEVKS